MAFFIEWDDDFLLGIPSVDSQHKIFFEKLNLLFVAIREQQEQEVIDTILSEFIQYADYHFQFEESFLEKHGYPELNRHKHLHDEYLNNIIRMVRVEHNEFLGNVKVFQFLRDWFSHHILKDDCEYSRYLTQNGIQVEET